MAGQHRIVETTIRLGGEDRILRFDFNALAELDALGIDMLGGGVSRLNAMTVRALVYAGLVARQMYEERRNYRGPALTLYEVGGMLSDPEAQRGAVDAVMALIQAGQPDEADVEAAAASAAGEGTTEAGKDDSDYSTSTPSPS